MLKKLAIFLALLAPGFVWAQTSTGISGGPLPYAIPNGQPTNGQCAVFSSTYAAFIPASCTGGGTVTTTGSPANGNLTKFSGAATITNGDLSGDVATSGTLATTIQPAAVTLAKMANLAANSIIGNNTGVGATPLALTVAQTHSLLNLPDGTAGLLRSTNATPGVYSAAELSGDCTTSGSNAVTCLKTNNVAFGTSATVNTGTSGGTIPLLNGTNTWSGVQTFAASGIKLTGSSTGVTTFASANAGASNFTLTFPALTDTLATLGTAQSFTAAQTLSSTALIPTGNISIATSGNLPNGFWLQGGSPTYTDSSSAGGTIARISAATFPTVTFAASVATTYTNADVVYIPAPVACSGNVTCTALNTLEVGGTLLSDGLLKGALGLNAFGGGILLNNNSNNTTQINTGTSTGALHLGDGTGNNTITIGNGTGTTQVGSPLISVNTNTSQFTVASGTGACATTSTIQGGVQAGNFTCTGTTGASTATLTLKATTNAYTCWGRDITTATTVTQTGAKSTTSVTLTFTSVTANDVVQFGCLGY